MRVRDKLNMKIVLKVLIFNIYRQGLMPILKKICCKDRT